MTELSLGLLFWGMFSYASGRSDVVMYGAVLMVMGLVHLAAFGINLWQMGAAGK